MGFVVCANVSYLFCREKAEHTLNYGFVVLAIVTGILLAIFVIIGVYKSTFSSGASILTTREYLILELYFPSAVLSLHQPTTG